MKITTKKQNVTCSCHRGQAIYEFIVASLAITIVFIGFLQVSSLSGKNVSNYLDARGVVDTRISSGSGGLSSDQYVHDWDYGEDGLWYTGDDVRINSAPLNTIEAFSSELSDPFDLVDGFEDFGIAEKNSFSDALTLNTVLDSTDLSSGTSTTHVELERALQAFVLGHSAEITLSDTVFMPSLNLFDEEGSGEGSEDE